MALTPDDWKRWKGCMRKMKLSDVRSAKEEAMKNKQRAYKCQYCNGWHLTSH